MARCSSCKKFVAYGEPDVGDIEVTLEDTTLTLCGTISLTCADCGGAVAEAGLDAEEDVVDHFDRQPDEAAGEVAEYEIQGKPDVGPTERADTTATIRRGKDKGKVVPVKNSRYARHYYGVEATCTVVQTIRNKAGEPLGTQDETEITLCAEEQASSFEAVS